LLLPFIVRLAQHRRREGGGRGLEGHKHAAAVLPAVLANDVHITHRADFFKECLGERGQPVTTEATKGRWVARVGTRIGEGAWTSAIGSPVGTWPTKSLGVPLGGAFSST
jgi:hypothetical protein